MWDFQGIRISTVAMVGLQVVEIWLILPYDCLTLWQQCLSLKIMHLHLIIVDHVPAPCVRFPRSQNFHSCYSLFTSFRGQLNIGLWLLNILFTVLIIQNYVLAFNDCKTCVFTLSWILSSQTKAQSSGWASQEQCLHCFPHCWCLFTNVPNPSQQCLYSILPSSTLSKWPTY